jgi:predicted tellurium resistance membrane protein TerC
MMELLANPQTWIAFATLTALELVLGIDNIIFISILVDKLPRKSASSRAASGCSWPCSCASACCWCWPGSSGWWRRLFTVLGRRSPGRDLILILGGLFLIWKSTGEIHQSMEGERRHASSAVKATFTAVILQIMLIDLVFSLDSIITAVGMVDDVRIMIAAVVASVGLMMLFAGPIGRFVSDHPTIKMLALSFLVVVGVVLVAEGFGHHVPKGYVYFGMAFSLAVEMLNIRRGAV